MSDSRYVTGVWEHYIENSAITPVTPARAFAREVHAPAGRNFHVSAGDLAKFMAAHFPYGDHLSLLTRRSVLNMQKETQFAATSPGWFIGHNWWSDYKTVYHSGDNGKSIALLVFSPKFEAGYVLMANIAGDLAWQGLDTLAAEIEEYLGSTISRAGAPVLRMAESSLCRFKSAQASNTYYEMSEYSPEMALDGLYYTRWATDDGIQDAWIEIDLGESQTIGGIIIKEEFAPRVSSWKISAKADEAATYTEVMQGSDIGDELIVNPTPFAARWVRLDVHTDGSGGPTLSEFQLFREKITQAY